MEVTVPPEFSIPKDILQPLLNLGNCSTVDDALQILIKSARTESGRSELASNNTIPVVLELTKFLSSSSTCCFLPLCLKLLRNLCAGEFQNQTSFIVNSGVEILSVALSHVGFGSDSDSDSDIGIFQTGLQLLGNVSQAGEEHQQAIWRRFFPDQFTEIVRMRRAEICDPLCMVIYTCCKGSLEREEELCGFQGLKVVSEIIKTASTVGFGEEWLKWLLSKVCFEGYHFPTLFYQLSLDDVTGDSFNSKVTIFSEEQAFLLSLLSESLNQQTGDISVSNESAMCVFGILKKALGTVDFSSRGTSGLPTSISAVDVLGYSMIILRDVCAQYDPGSSNTEGSVDIVDSLISSGLLELLLNILRDLEPPETIRKSNPQGESQNMSRPHDLLNKCPYKGFRRDVVAVIGNCVYQRKHAQDEIRKRNGLYLLLQQCGRDDDNPFSREWGFWLTRNLFGENEENKREVAGLALQGTLDAPEITALGLKLVMDEKTRRPKLVNIVS